ncbi:glucosylglycerol-phosphate synthase [Chitinophaga sp. GCM10012297]|uniref:Glucosylglycerol-phosphate synthase n=1 Tax=Chitinophaga chungangae TaxID=2821488 RepID=A0ABS3YHA6_9BACT|nr:glucosylglycerol-phosphate synthase [Chitinophaga chungangae]MBO9154057.1 glucosylglycerol-phosphate synthase [Chitinophaga chungangae]
MILATDLDGTFLGGSVQHKEHLYKTIRENDDFRLIFVTGRGVESVLPLLSDPVIPRPDYIICDVGATVLDGHTLRPVQPIQNNIELKWPGKKAVMEAVKNIKGIRLQQVPQQRRVSFFFDDERVKSHVSRLEDTLGCDIIFSAGKFLDVLPSSVNKGSTLRNLVDLLQVPQDKVLVAGDTLNDLSLYGRGFRGVIVGEAEEALTEAAQDLHDVYVADSAGAGGILEALHHFEPFRPFYKKMPENDIPETESDQLVMLYHRFPFETVEENGKKVRRAPKSPNGILPTLTSFFKTGRPGLWIAWQEAQKGQKQADNFHIDRELYPELEASPVMLEKEDIDIFYKLFSKEAFWPAIFSFIEKVQFNHEHWEHYLKVNRIFAEKAAAEAEPNAMVWIHDYNLWMVPGYLRQLRPDLKIGFFHHTAFPAANTFNIIPWRSEIIHSLLQCDYVSFHIPRYVENFVDVVKSMMPVKITEQENAAPRFLTYSCAMGTGVMTREIDTGRRKVRLGANPVGVHVDYIRELTEKPSVQALISQLKKPTTGKKTILSIERLDYVKGPLEKLKAFHQFLEQHPNMHGKVELINICTPPASGMKIYEQVQQEMEQLIGKINGQYSTIDWVPIHFFFRSFSFEEVLAYYAVADVAWITPLRDGLNLVAKEYVAVQGLNPDSAGVLVLSEFAGASVELPNAILTNPYDNVSMIDSLLEAISMNRAERQIRMKRLYQIVSHYNIEFWADEFMQELSRLHQEIPPPEVSLVKALENNLS